MTASGTTSVMGTTDGPVHIIRLDDGKATRSGQSQQAIDLARSL